MERRIQNRWVQALETDEFSQARMAMRQRYMGKFMYCPLGVLCELFRKEMALPENVWQPEFPPGLNRVTYYAFRGFRTFLPESVMEWAGLDEQNPVLYDDGVESFRMVTANDHIGMTFFEIAQLIRKL